MKARDTTILMTIYYLALRPKEACSLRFDDFDLKRMVVKIRAETNKQHKEREIPLPEQLFSYLQNYLTLSRTRFWRGSPFLFPSFESNCISSQHWKYTFREKILKPAGLWRPPEHPETGNRTSPFRSYTLRHTRATELLNKTKDIFLVANVLGHAKLSSTKVYLHKTDDYVEYMRRCLSQSSN